MPTPATIVTSDFVLDRNEHWKALGGDERSRQEAISEFITTEATFYERLTILHEVRQDFWCSLYIYRYSIKLPRASLARMRGGPSSKILMNYY